MFVRDWMNRRPLTASPDEPVAEAAERMRRHGLPLLPVTEGSRLVGWLALSDLHGPAHDPPAPEDPDRIPPDPVAARFREACAALSPQLGYDLAALVLQAEPLASTQDPGQAWTVTLHGPAHDPSAPQEPAQWAARLARLQAGDPEGAEGGFLSWLTAPVSLEGARVGAVGFWSRRGGAYAASDLPLLEWLASQMAWALEERRRALALDRRARGLEEALRLRDEVLAVSTHDLGDALQGVLSYARLLERRTATLDEVGELAAELVRATSYTAALIADLHERARRGLRAIELRREPVALESVVGAVLESWQETARARAVELRQGGPCPPLTLLADPLRLRQVLTNLVSNAVKYNRPGGWVELRWSQASDRVLLEVEDSGIGIPEEHQPGIFNPFTRVDPSSAEGGSGLGLGITRQLVELHGGQLELARSSARGSLFRVALPARLDPAPGPSREVPPLGPG